MLKFSIDECIFKRLETCDIHIIATAFKQLGWQKPISLYEKYLQEQNNKRRIIWVAFFKNVFVGYVTLVLHSEYPPFADQKIPEINDLNVLPQFRNQGIGSELIELAELEAQKHSTTVGLGVGLTADYGAAQRLYVKRGYIPDGQGITSNLKQCKHGDVVSVDDDLILWLTKHLNNSDSQF